MKNTICAVTIWRYGRTGGNIHLLKTRAFLTTLTRHCGRNINHQLYKYHDRHHYPRANPGILLPCRSRLQDDSPACTGEYDLPIIESHPHPEIYNTHSSPQYISHTHHGRLTPKPDLPPPDLPLPAARPRSQKATTRNQQTHRTDKIQPAQRPLPPDLNP